MEWCAASSRVRMTLPKSCPTLILEALLCSRVVLEERFGIVARLGWQHVPQEFPDIGRLPFGVRRVNRLIHLLAKPLQLQVLAGTGLAQALRSLFSTDTLKILQNIHLAGPQFIPISTRPFNETPQTTIFDLRSIPHHSCHCLCGFSRLTVWSPYLVYVVSTSGLSFSLTWLLSRLQKPRVMKCFFIS